MTLTETERLTLNNLLSDKKIVLPDHRRTVFQTGGNYEWLQKNISKRNPNVSPEIVKLLKL